MRMEIGVRVHPLGPFQGGEVEDEVLWPCYQGDYACAWPGGGDSWGDGGQDWTEKPQGQALGYHRQPRHAR